MNYEKAYKEALEKARQFSERPLEEDSSTIVEYIFPELKESEDERIRKELITHCRNTRCVTEEGAERIAKWIAWLEKQGEQKPIIEMKSSEESLGISSKEYNEIVNECLYGESKPADKVKPKFKVGDWIISDIVDKDYHICKITGIKDGNYTIESIYGYKGYNQFNVFDNAYRLWDVTKDAKPGDVLAYDDGFVIIVKELKSSEWGWRLTRHCALLLDGTFTLEEVHTKVNGLHPATNAQRDFLFQKMKEAGYEWDAEKKKLSKRVIDEGKSEIDYCFTKMMNGEKVNPIWSEDDERMLNDAIGAVDTTDYYTYDDKQEIENWLESLKQRIGE